MPFLTSLVMKPHGSNNWILTEELHYGTHQGQLIKIHAGFVTDLASIPRAARLLIPVNGRHREAAVLHDYLYSNKGKFRDKRNEPHTKHEWTRLQCDRLFHIAMLECRVPKWKAQLMYWAVRAGGWVYFNRKD